MDLIILPDYGFVNRKYASLKSMEEVMLKYGVMYILPYGKYVLN